MNSFLFVYVMNLIWRLFFHFFKEKVGVQVNAPAVLLVDLPEDPEMKMIGWIIMKTHLVTLPSLVEPEPEIQHLYNSKSPSGPNVKRKNVDFRRRCGDENLNYWRKSRRNRENWRVWSTKRERYVLLRFRNSQSGGIFPSKCSRR